MAKAADKALDEVYLGDFEGFVARRDALAKQLREDGDADRADEVKALRKPSRTAWAVNQFSAHGGKQRTALLKAGTALREAQEGLVSGDVDRSALTKARDRERSAVSAALEAIAALAADSGPALNTAASDRVRHTLHAIALDDDVRGQFEEARLIANHEASGLGGGSLAAGAGTGGRKKPAPAKQRKRDKEAERRRRRRDELKEAEADAAKRARELESAELELAEAKKAAERAQGDLKRAGKQRDRAQTDAEKAVARVDDLRED